MRRSFRPSQTGAISKFPYRNDIENIQDYIRHGRSLKAIDRWCLARDAGPLP
jgi:hypothetical protein